MPTSFSVWLAIFGIRGFSAGMVSACASSGHSLGFAFDEVRRGRQKRMLVVGGEDCNFESIAPFAGMRALSLDRDPATASRPFDKTRNGFVGSGGATCLILENEEEKQRTTCKRCYIRRWKYDTIFSFRFS